MMILMKRKFVYKEHGWWSKGVRSSAHLSNDLITKLFDIPKGIKIIWISLHSKSAPNRHIAKVRMVDCDFPGVIVETEGRNYGFDDPVLDRNLKPLVGKTVYLDCEYEI